MTTHNDESLKPCPWCQSKEQHLSSNGWDNHMVVCECGAEGPAADTPSLARTAWNRRAEQPQPAPTQSEWQSLAACMYQAAGAFDMPVRFLDALSAAQRGESFAHLLSNLLPVSAPQWNAARDDHIRDATNMVPTEQMIDAGVAFALQVTISGDYNWSAYMRDLFINMAAAAPSNKEVER